jgi:acetyl esterase/lipase
MTEKFLSSQDVTANTRRNFLKALGVAGAIGASATSLFAEDDCLVGIEHPKSKRGEEIAKMAHAFKVERDIVFVKRPERSLKLDVYSPVKKSKEPLPAIISFGFAAWVNDTKDLCLDLNNVRAFPTPYLFPPAMVSRGFVLVSAETRVAKEAKFPAQIYDAKCTAQWIRAHAKELNVDPEHIGVIGGSASGYLAAMLALTRPEDGFEDKENFLGVPSSIQAAYCGSGMYDFEYYHQVPGEASLPVQVAQFLGGTFDEIPDLCRKASPTQYVRPGAPPFLLTHGLQDRRVPYEQQTHFVEVLAKAGIPTQAIYINHMAHSIPTVPPDPGYTVTDPIIYNFFDTYLKNPTHDPRP